jgi:DNA-binding response OmpR family regulator
MGHGLERRPEEAPRPGDTPPEAAPREKAAARAPLSRRWIVVADDDHGVRRYLTKVLESAGYAVVVARDGLEALEVIRDLRPHLVILDLRMPEMSGRELLKVMADVPVLVLSGYLGDLSDAEKALPNVIGQLQKPVDPATLRTRVGEALRGFNP